MADKNNKIVQDEASAMPTADEQTAPAAEDDTTEQKGSDSEHHHHHHHHHHHRHHHRHRHHRHRRHRSRRHSHSEKKTRAKHIAIIAVVLLLTALLVAGASFLAIYRQGKDLSTQNNINITAPDSVTVGKKGEYVIYNGHRYNYNKEVDSILFMGVDDTETGKGSAGGHMADVLTLFAIDKKSNTINVINVPRDIMTDIGVYSPDGGYLGRERQAIAAAYAYGDGGDTSCLNTAEAVSRLFYNLPVKTYISLRMEGIQEINDAVGGVDVVSPETITPFEKGKTYHLENDLTRKFVQLRSMERSDANLLRNERQKTYFSAFLQKTISQTKQNISLPVDLYQISKPYSATNLNPDRITYFATEYVVKRKMKLAFKSVPVDVQMAGEYSENIVKEKEFYEMFLSIFYTKAD